MLLLCRPKARVKGVCCLQTPVGIWIGIGMGMGMGIGLEIGIWIQMGMGIFWMRMRW